MELLIILILGVVITAVILPWVNYNRVSSLNREIARLDSEVLSLSRKVSMVGELRANIETKKVNVVLNEDSKVKDEDVSKTALVSEKPTKKAEIKPPEIKKIEPVVEEIPHEEWTATEPINVENESEESKDWFGKLAVWVGGIALLMAGFYMVKHSINSGWMTPQVRVWATASFGTLLCVSGFVMSRKSDAPGSIRVVQALTGAGVACLYFAVYAGVNLYALMTPEVGFVGMIGVTILAVGLSLCHGLPIALMGFMGGFLTPMLMGNFHDDSISLFGYLFVLLGAAQFLCAKRGWWGLFFGALITAYIWSVVIFFTDKAGSYPEGSLLFTLGVCALNAVLVLFLKTKDSECRFIPMIRFLTWGWGLVQVLTLVYSGGFEMIDMSLFALLAFGALVLAVFREREFLWAACFAFLVTLLGSVLNTTEVSLLRFSVWPVVIAVVFFGVSHFKALKSEYASYWRALSVGSLIMTALAVFVNSEFLSEFSAPWNIFWLLLSIVVSSLILASAEHLKRLKRADILVFSSYSAVASFLVGLGLWDYLAIEYLPLGLACLILVTAVYWKVRKLVCADVVFGILSSAWLLAMLPSIINALAYTLNVKIAYFTHLGWRDFGVWYTGVAVLAVVLHWFRGSFRGTSRKFSNWVLGIVALLVLVTTYQYFSLTIFSSWNSAESLKGGLTALLASLSVGSVLISSRWAGGIYASRLMFAVVGYRIVVVHFLGQGAQGDSFFFNALFWQFGVPFFSAFTISWIGRVRELGKITQVYQVVAMLLGFVWATFLVQDYSGSSHLFAGVDTNTELYTYSVVWLLLAVVYQGLGLWRGIRTLHIGSLLLLLLTVGKVFFVDASELEGLYRVLSFLGLGVALIGIGFFYNKVVFGKSEH